MATLDQGALKGSKIRMTTRAFTASGCLSDGISARAVSCGGRPHRRLDHSVLGVEVASQAAGEGLRPRDANGCGCDARDLHDENPQFIFLER